MTTNGWLQIAIFFLLILAVGFVSLGITEPALAQKKIDAILKDIDSKDTATRIRALKDAAINLDAGKNLVGVFHHPSLVAIEPAAFATLDPRDIAAGLGESLKTALVADPEWPGAPMTSRPGVV